MEFGEGQLRGTHPTVQDSLTVEHRGRVGMQRVPTHELGVDLLGLAVVISVQSELGEVLHALPLDLHRGILVGDDARQQVHGDLFVLSRRGTLVAGDRPLHGVAPDLHFVDHHLLDLPLEHVFGREPLTLQWAG